MARPIDLPPSPPRAARTRGARGGLGTLVLSLLPWIAAGCRSSFLDMPNGSMEPTIRAGEIIQLDQAAYRSQAPARWDLIAFHPAQHPDRLWVLRVVGLPGERLDSDGERLLADGQPLELPFRWRSLERESSDYRAGQIRFPVVVPDGQYFVLGDNAREANDSRFWGPVTRSQIVGKVVPRLSDAPDRYAHPHTPPAQPSSR